MYQLKQTLFKYPNIDTNASKTPNPSHICIFKTALKKGTNVPFKQIDTRHNLAWYVFYLFSFVIWQVIIHMETSLTIASSSV